MTRLYTVHGLYRMQPINKLLNISTFDPPLVLLGQFQHCLNHNIFIQHRFLDNTTFPVYVTACDLEKSFTFDNESSPKSFGKRRFTIVNGRNGLARCVC